MKLNTVEILNYTIDEYDDLFEIVDFDHNALVNRHVYLIAHLLRTAGPTMNDRLRYVERIAGILCHFVIDELRYEIKRSSDEMSDKLGLPRIEKEFTYMTSPRFYIKMCNVIKSFIMQLEEIKS